jgi:translation elongation factor EF-4
MRVNELRLRLWQMFIWLLKIILEIIPVINKIDLPAADVEKVANEIINLI